MAELYPLYLNLEGKPCLVVGGGAVACRKTGALLRAGARVTVVAPEAAAELEELSRKDKVELLRRAFRPKDVQGRWLVFCATDDAQVNGIVFQASEAACVPCNVADHPRACRFHVPARWTGGKVQVAVSTSGAAPVLGARMARKIGKTMGPWAPRLAEWLQELRAHLKERIPGDPDRRGAFLRALLEAHGEEMEGLAAREDRAGFSALVEEALERLEPRPTE